MSDSLNRYELNNVRELVKDLEEVIEGINETLDDHETRITDLEEE